MRIEQGEERKETDISISAIVKDGGRLNILPSAKKYFSIDYKPKKGVLSLVCGGYIGLIPINENLAIQIRPKVPIPNLTRIVTIAEDKFDTLNFFLKKYKESADFNPTIFEFMAECLANELQTLDSEGILKEYCLAVDHTEKIKGRISLNDSIKSLWGHGHFQKAVIKYHDFTVRNPFNQLIKYTLDFCIRELDTANPENKKLKERLADFYSLFDAVELREGQGFFDAVFEAIKSDKLTTLRRYYVNICEICRLILQRRSISFHEAGDDLEMSSFVLDMSNIFEKYALNSVRAHRNLFPPNTLIMDGNKEGRKKFYNEPSVGDGDAKPDVIIKNGTEHKIVADVKYKSSSKEADRYQVISHALSYNSKKAVLVLPKDESRGYSQALIKLGSVGKDFEIEVYEYYFNLSSGDLEKEEHDLAQSLSSLC